MYVAVKWTVCSRERPWTRNTTHIHSVVSRYHNVQLCPNHNSFSSFPIPQNAHKTPACSIRSKYPNVVSIFSCNWVFIADLTYNYFQRSWNIIMSYLRQWFLGFVFPVPCPRGYYLSDSQCHPCPTGSYQDKMGQASCNSCPKGRWTTGMGKNNVQHCLGMVEISDYCFLYKIVTGV